MCLRIGLRACGMTAALLGTALGVVPPSTADNTSPQAEAHVVSAQALGGLVDVPPTPDSKFPPGGTASLPTLILGPVNADALLTATTAGDAKAGTASATATTAHLALTIPLVSSLDVTAIKASCDAPAGANPLFPHTGREVSSAPPSTSSSRAAHRSLFGFPCPARYLPHLTPTSHPGRITSPTNHRIPPS